MIVRDSWSGAEIAALRTVMGLTQQELSTMVGVHPLTCKAWEQGRQRITPEHAERVAAVVERHREYAAWVAREGGVDIVRVPDAGGELPRGWQLAAAGAALVAGENVNINWA